MKVIYTMHGPVQQLAAQSATVHLVVHSRSQCLILKLQQLLPLTVITDGAITQQSLRLAATILPIEVDQQFLGSAFQPCYDISGRQCTAIAAVFSLLLVLMAMPGLQ